MTTNNKMMTGLMLGAVLALSAVTPTAQAQTSSSEMSAKTITTVIDSLVQFEGGYIIRRPNNGGAALKILDASIFTEDKIRSLEQSFENRTAVKLVISGSTVIDIVR